MMSVEFGGIAENVMSVQASSTPQMTHMLRILGMRNQGRNPRPDLRPCLFLWILVCFDFIRGILLEPLMEINCVVWAVKDVFVGRCSYCGLLAKKGSDAY